MIKLFGITDTVFNSNGDKILKPLKAKVHKEDNGDYYLELETGLEYINDLTENRVIVADMPQGSQAFRISNIRKTRTKLSLKCWHVSYDTRNYLIADSYVVNKTASQALAWLNAATEPTTIFETGSDVTGTNSFRCVRQSLYEAIQTIVERWGGHLVRDNFYIYLASSIGQDNDVVVRYRKNLKNITCDENWSNVCTKIMPVGYDGLLLPEVYLVSDVQYTIPYTKTVSFTQDIDVENYASEADYQDALEADLRAQATEYLNTNKYPKVNYSLSADIDKISDIGDIIQVIDEQLGVNITTNVIAYEYDCILKKYTKIEFGNFRESLSKLASDIQATASQFQQIRNLSDFDETGSNYLRMPNGFQICWGHDDFGTLEAGADANKTITFTKSFKNTSSYEISVFSEYQYPSKFDVVGTKPSASTFNAYGVNRHSSAISNTSFGWIAIGKWK